MRTVSLYRNNAFMTPNVFEDEGKYKTQLKFYVQLRRKANARTDREGLREMRIDKENFIKDQKGDKNLVCGISQIRKVEGAKWSLRITSRQNTEEDEKVAAADGEWAGEIT
ncbi:hypothetical protein RUM43_012975 [Polyplax serrata]|uniref:Uncharacterized protein n=1 Tax=Polyplax serrata TaxID=468196 RepID=A0AAN8NRB3_POLSC